MKLNIMPGRIVVKQHAAKLKGVIQLPPNRAKLYEIGEVVAVGALEGYGPEGKYSTKETYAEGDLVLFQLPASLAAGITFDIKGSMNCFLHIEDVLAKLSCDLIDIKNFQIAGRFLLLTPSVREASNVIITPGNAEEARKEQLHFSVLQWGKDVKHTFAKGQEVFPDKGRVNPITLDNQEFVFTDQQFIYGTLDMD